MGQQVIIRF